MRLFPTLALALLLAAGAGLTGCAEAQRMMNDAANAAGTAAGNGGMNSTTEASWTMDGREYRGRSGTFAFDCPPTQDVNQYGFVRGSNPYSDYSPVCKAGVHAGVITARGGRVTIQPRPVQNRYAGSTRNGIRSIDSNGAGEDGSFTVVR